MNYCLSNLESHTLLFSVLPMQCYKNKCKQPYLNIDECATGTHSCIADAECNNIKGSHNCQCKSGYSGNGRTCTGNWMEYCMLDLQPNGLLRANVYIYIYIYIYIYDQYFRERHASDFVKDRLMICLFRFRRVSYRNT